MTQARKAFAIHLNERRQLDSIFIKREGGGAVQIIVCKDTFDLAVRWDTPEIVKVKLLLL